MTTGERIKKIRTEKGMSQRAFGKLINKPHTGVSKIERGIQEITICDLHHICNVLNITPLDLIHVPTEALTKELEKREGLIADFYGG